MSKSVCQWVAAAVCLLCSSVQAQESSFLPPVMGWSSWNTYRIHISEELIRKQTDAMLSQGLKDVGYSYINIDDGFFDGRDEEGNLKIQSRTFPERAEGGGRLYPLQRLQGWHLFRCRQ